MIPGPLAAFWRDVRDGFAGFEQAHDWEDWLAAAQKNIVALTIVFCFVLITGSCVAVPVIALLRGGEETAPAAPVEAPDEGAPGGSRNPWSLDR